MFRKFIKNEVGTVAIVGALALPALLGVMALVAEFGHGLSTKIEDQRVADLAAFAGAMAYNSSNSTATMTSAATGVASLNGIPTSGVTSTLVSSPTGDGNQAVLVKISSSNTLLLAPVLGFGSQLPVTSSSYAELTVQAPACIVALNGAGTGVSLSGSTSISAPGCSIASDASVSVPCGTTMTTKTVAYDSSGAPSEPCNGIVPPSGTASVKLLKTATTDPLASNTGVSAASARETEVADLTSPSAPSVPTGGDISFAYTPNGPTGTIAQASADSCAASFSGSTWTLICSGASTYKFGNITLGGGITVNFNTSGSASTTYDFSGSIANSGTALNFGPGVYNIAQGITTGGGTTTSFGVGTFNVGAGTSSCNGNGDYSICNTGTSLTFGGPSTFVLAAGVYNAGGSTLTLGSGSSNSFQIGASSSGDAIYAGGSAITTFADALGGSSLFSVTGNVDVASGGSCLTVSAAAQHDINGYFSSAGGTTLGAGVYTVSDYIAFGANGGGSVTCNGTSVGVTGVGVTLVIAGLDTPTSGSCAGQAFCVGAGFSDVSLSAPTSGATAGLVIVGPTSSSNTAGLMLTEGASSISLSGAVYFPNGPISVEAGASLGGGTGQCLELIGSQVTLSGGSAVGSTCIQSGSSSASVLLVQ